MKHRTAELEGALLDAAVAKAEGLPWREFAPQSYILGEKNSWIWIEGWPTEPCGMGGGYPMPYRPSSDGRHGVPIIDRERIGILPYAHEGEYEYDADGNNPRLTAPPRWWAQVMDADTGGWIEVCPAGDEDRNSDAQVGPTPLIAAMRAFVTSKFGGEVDLP